MAYSKVGISANGCKEGACPVKERNVGFNDMMLAAQVSPPLTTVRVPEYEVGRRAAELLLAHIGDPERPAETVFISSQLVVRSSTAPPADQG